MSTLRNDSCLFSTMNMRASKRRYIGKARSCACTGTPGTATKPLRRGDQLQPRIDTDLRAIQHDAKLVRSFFRASHVAYIADV